MSNTRYKFTVDELIANLPTLKEKYVQNMFCCGGKIEYFSRAHIKDIRKTDNGSHILVVETPNGEHKNKLINGESVTIEFLYEENK